MNDAGKDTYSHAVENSVNPTRKPSGMLNFF